MTDDTQDLEIATEAPTDEDGHPVHPERGHRICAAMKSKRTTPTNHGRERDEFEYCTLAAGWGVDGKTEGACSHHTGAIDNQGENNPNYEHGAFLSHFTDHLTDSETDALDDVKAQLETPEGAQDVARTAAATCLLQFQRSGDERFLRRFEGLCDKFGIAPADELDVNHSGLEEMFMDDLRSYHEGE